MDKEYLEFFCFMVRSQWIFGFNTPIEAMVQEYRINGLTDSLMKYGKIMLKQYVQDRISIEDPSGDEIEDVCCIYPVGHFFAEEFNNVIRTILKGE